jgi:chlorobactene glucosyltransferase
MLAHWQEHVAYALYLLVGPGMWMLVIIGMIQTYKRMNLVKRWPDPLPKPPPKVTILVPAKDEKERIAECLRSALNQDYPDFHVIAIDDRSTDGTGTVMDELAKEDPRLSVIHLTELPDGWTGKCNALHQGVQRAKGEWLLFFDSDVVLDSNALSATLGTAIERKFRLFSLLPRMECQSLLEGLLVPLAGAAVTAIFAAAWTNSNSSPRSAFANGQFLLIRRDAYDAVGGHSAVRDQYCEDMALARIFKDRGLRPRMCWGTNLCSVRMYDSLATIMRGWSRIFYAASFGTPWRSLLGISFVTICGYSMIPAFIFGFFNHNHVSGMIWMCTALFHWLLMTIQIGFMYHWTLNPRRYALASPLTSVFLLAILFRSIWMCMTKRVEWRGTKYHHSAGQGIVTGG